MHKPKKKRKKELNQAKDVLSAAHLIRLEEKKEAVRFLPPLPLLPLYMQMQLILEFQNLRLRLTSKGNVKKAFVELHGRSR